MLTLLTLPLLPLSVCLSLAAQGAHRDKRAKTGFVLNPMDEAMQRKCDSLVKGLMKRSQGVHFSRPVEWKKMGLLDYPKLIKDPMDLGTVCEKLAKSNMYQRLEHFVNDVRLVWNNAIAYNSAESMFGVVAGILAQVFDRRFALITRSATADPGRPIPDRPGWPTFQQKKKFYDLCTRLTLADLNQMVSLVQRGCPTAVQQCGDKEVEVDVDELQMETFNKVMQWATSKTKTAPKTES